MVLSKLLLATLAGSASAVKLWVSSYPAGETTPGEVSTLEYTPGQGEGAASGSLKKLSSVAGCGSAPAWLDKTPGGGRIYCVNEGWSDPLASLHTLTINEDGSLKELANISAVQGPVASQFYNKNGAVALAHYGGSAISNFKLGSDGLFTPLQNFTFQAKGPRPEQEASHVHHSVLDPTGQYIVFPDLGADLVRIYRIDPATSQLTAAGSQQTKPGSGPRHAAFWSPKANPDASSDIYLYVIQELSNRIEAFKVKYPPTGTPGNLTLDCIQEIGLYGDKGDQVGSRAAEISVSPDNKFIIASNRNATVFNVPNPDPSNSTEVPSDSLVTFRPAENGTLSFVQLAPSGGKFPRHFALNKAGDLVAVANQNSPSVDIWAREVETGILGKRVASSKEIAGGVNMIVWDE